MAILWYNQNNNYESKRQHIFLYLLFLKETVNNIKCDNFTRLILYYLALRLKEI